MGKPVTIGQSHNVISTLANNVDWRALDGDHLQRQVIDNPRAAGKAFTAFLRARIEGARNILRIDRSKPFDPVDFLAEGWSIAEQDTRFLSIVAFDLSKVRLETCRAPGEPSITGEEKLERLKRAGHYRLDAKVFQTLWENQDCIPAIWEEQMNGSPQCIFFDGTVLGGPGGIRCVLCLSFGGGSWFYFCRRLSNALSSSDQSAILAST